LKDPPLDNLAALGTATLQEDGTLRLDLQRNYDTRTNFHKVLLIHQDNPRYQQYLDHIGGIELGERKPIPSWP
jgi:hypothetical protein